MALKQSRLIAVLLVAFLLNSCTASHTDGIGRIRTDNYANTTLEYYYYIPQAVIESDQESHPVLVLVPGLSGRGEDFVTSKFKRFADSEAMAIVAPSFVWDEDNWDSRQSYQFPSAWSGNALLEIIAQVEEKHGIAASRLYVFGFSAGAQFALRFCLWRPDECTACVAHMSGGTVIPDRRVDVSFLVTAGTQDSSRIEKAKAFRDAAQDLGIDVTYIEYNVGHSMTAAQVEDSLAFLAGQE